MEEVIKVDMLSKTYGNLLAVYNISFSVKRVTIFFPMSQGIQLMKATFLGLPVNNIKFPVIVMGTVAMLCTGISIKYFKWE